jgi:hypothetical protein
MSLALQKRGHANMRFARQFLIVLNTFKVYKACTAAGIGIVLLYNILPNHLLLVLHSCRTWPMMSTSVAIATLPAMLQVNSAMPLCVRTIRSSHHARIPYCRTSASQVKMQQGIVW